MVKKRAGRQTGRDVAGIRLDHGEAVLVHVHLVGGRSLEAPPPDDASLDTRVLRASRWHPSGA